MLNVVLLAQIITLDIYRVANPDIYQVMKFNSMIECNRTASELKREYDDILNNIIAKHSVTTGVIKFKCIIE